MDLNRSMRSWLAHRKKQTFPWIGCQWITRGGDWTSPREYQIIDIFPDSSILSTIRVRYRRVGAIIWHEMNVPLTQAKAFYADRRP